MINLNYNHFLRITFQFFINDAVDMKVINFFLINNR